MQLSKSEICFIFLYFLVVILVSVAIPIIRHRRKMRKLDEELREHAEAVLRRMKTRRALLEKHIQRW